MQFSHADETQQLKRAVFISNRNLNLYRDVGLLNGEMGGILVKSVTYGIEAFRNENILFLYSFFFRKIN